MTTARCGPRRSQERSRRRSSTPRSAVGGTRCARVEASTPSSSSSPPGCRAIYLRSTPHRYRPGEVGHPGPYADHRGQVEIVSVSPADAPSNAATSFDEVVGRYASVPILAGQDVDRRAIEQTPGERAFGFGAPMAAGQVAFALPVDPSQAVGGALVPGARIDVVAVPNALDSPSLGSSGRRCQGQSCSVVPTSCSHFEQGMDSRSTAEHRRSDNAGSSSRRSSAASLSRSPRTTFRVRRGCRVSTFYLALSQQPGVAQTP